MNRNDLKMNRNEYIQQRAAIDEAAREIAMDMIREQFPDVEWTPTGKCKLLQNGTLARLHPEYHENAGVLPPLFLPLTAFITVYNILRRNPESVESAIPTWHHFTPFYAIIKIQIPPSAPVRKIAHFHPFSSLFILICVEFLTF